MGLSKTFKNLTDPKHLNGRALFSLFKQKNMYFYCITLYRQRHSYSVWDICANLWIRRLLDSVYFKSLFTALLKPWSGLNMNGFIIVAQVQETGHTHTHTRWEVSTRPSYHVTLDLIGGAGAGAVCLGRRLRSVWLDKTSSVNQTAKRKKWMIEWDRESGNVGEGGGEKRMCVCARSPPPTQHAHTQEQMAASDAVATSALCSWLHEKVINGMRNSCVGVWAGFDVNKPLHAPSETIQECSSVI